MAEEVRFDIVDGKEPRSGRIMLEYEGKLVLALESANPHLLIGAALVVLGFGPVRVDTPHGMEEFDIGGIQREASRQTAAVCNAAPSNNGNIALVLRYSEALDEYRVNIFLDDGLVGSSVDGHFDCKTLLGILFELQYVVTCDSIPK